MATLGDHMALHPRSASYGSSGSSPRASLLRLLLVIAVLLPFFGSIPLARAQEELVNVLANGGFEADADGNSRPDGWSSTGRFTRSTAVVRTNSYSGRHAATDNANYTITQTIPSVRPGTSYRFSGWLIIPATTDSFFIRPQVRWLSTSGRVLRSCLKRVTLPTVVPSSGSWRGRSSLHYWLAAPYTPDTSDGTGSATQMSAPRPSAGAARQSLSCRRSAAPAGG